MSAYYNEIDPFAAQWLRNLISAGLIAPGEVDERSIEDVRADDLKGFKQCHFFAGIGGWSYALRLAGWPDDEPVWTGSCPCQPFSNAGKRRGRDDERNLWPFLSNCIREQKPDFFFGEQVSTKESWAWLDHVRDDLEKEDYAIGTLSIPACSAGAPHLRERLWIAATRMAYSEFDRLYIPKRNAPKPRSHRAESGLSVRIGRELCTPHFQGHGETNGSWANADWMYCGEFNWPVEPGTPSLVDGLREDLELIGPYGNAIVPQVAAEFVGSFMAVNKKLISSRIESAVFF